MSVERFKYLLSKYLSDNLTYKEKTEFFELVENGDFDNEIEADFKNSFYDEALNYSSTLPAKQDAVEKQTGGEKSKVILLSRRKMTRVLLQSAAALLFFVSVGLFVYFSNKQNDNTGAFFTEFVKSNQQAVKNNTNAAMAVLLPDNSIITLQPASSLYYSTSNFTSKREVYMQGKALFNITKNPKSPFYVYYKEVVTKVLGTSFNIYTSAATGNTEVEVLTGKVQVYANEKINSINKKRDEIIIVTPNQKAVYENVNHTITATLAEEPKLLSAKEKPANYNQQPTTTGFNFNNTKLADVIKNIELNYGIKISVSNERIYAYGFSGDITSQGLFDKLKIITLATRTQYQVKGTTIVISDIK